MEVVNNLEEKKSKKRSVGRRSLG